MTTTVRQLTKQIRDHRGKVMIPALTPHDVMHVVAEKMDLLDAVKSYSESPDDPAPWYVVTNKNGYLHLDVQR